MTVTSIYTDDDEVSAARGGENLRLRLAGVDEDEVAAGFVICSRKCPVPCVTYFDAQLQVRLSKLLFMRDSYSSSRYRVLRLDLCKYSPCPASWLIHSPST